MWVSISREPEVCRGGERSCWAGRGEQSGLGDKGREKLEIKGEKHAERKAQGVPWIVHVYLLGKGKLEMRKLHQRD